MIWTEWMIVLRPDGDLYIDRGDVGNPILQYYTNTVDYYTLNNR
jgi:hypothetical protein